MARNNMDKNETPASVYYKNTEANTSFEKAELFARFFKKIKPRINRANVYNGEKIFGNQEERNLVTWSETAFKSLKNTVSDMTEFQ